jgi:hypothetical protein
MATLQQLSLLDLLNNSTELDRPGAVAVSKTPILMEVPVAASPVPEMPVDPMVPPIVGDGIPPVIGRVFISPMWGRQPYFGYLYRWEPFNHFGKVVRYGVVALDGQDYRKGHFLISEEHVTILNDSYI